MNTGIQKMLARQYLEITVCRRRLYFIRDNYADLQERRKDASMLGYSKRKPLGRLLQLEVAKLKQRIDKIEKELRNIDCFY